MDLEEITLFEKFSQLEAYQDISNSTYIIPSSSVLSPLLDNEIHLFVRISIPQCYACSPLRLFLSMQKSAINVAKTNSLLIGSRKKLKDIQCPLTIKLSFAISGEEISILEHTTMSAKSLGTFPVICAIDEVQNPLPLKTMLFKKHMTSIIGISDTFTNS